MADPGGADRRVYPRYKILMHGHADPMHIQGAGRFPVVATNISMTGMLLHIDRGEMVHVNDLLRLSFHLLPAGKIVWLTGRIMWLERGLIPPLGNWSLGVLFHDTPQEAINRLYVPAREATLHDLDPGESPVPPPPPGKKPIPGLPGV